MLDCASEPLWELQARQWSRITAPLRPSPEDTRIADDVVHRWSAAAGRPPQALVLGSTPELASLCWPEGSDVLGVDRSPGMLRRVWGAAPPAPGHRRAVQGSWLDLPLLDACRDLVLADGSFSAIRRADGRPLIASIRRVLRESGTFLVRLCVRAPAESAEAVWSELQAGRLGSFTEFKLRLLMAMSSAEGEVHVQDVWHEVHARMGSLERLADGTGWSLDEVRAIDAYRNQPTVYWFGTLDEMRELFAEVFVEQACHWPSYGSGDRCPTLVLAPRS